MNAPESLLALEPRRLQPRALLGLHRRRSSTARSWTKIFYGPHWCYVGLEVEIPKVGDYRLTWVGERQVILVRDRVAPKDRGTDPGIRVVENRCAHRGVRFCQQPHGNARSFVCPYHQWTYKLNGELAGLPFKDGVKDGRCGPAACRAACRRTST